MHYNVWHVLAESIALANVSRTKVASGQWMALPTVEGCRAATIVQEADWALGEVVITSVWRGWKPERGVVVGV